MAEEFKDNYDADRLEAQMLCVTWKHLKHLSQWPTACWGGGGTTFLNVL